MYIWVGEGRKLTCVQRVLKLARIEAAKKGEAILEDVEIHKGSEQRKLYEA